MVERRVFVSATADRHLDDRRTAVKAAIIAKLSASGLAPQEFFQSGMAEDLAWTFDSIDRVMRKCVAAIIIGFPRWTVPGSPEVIGEYNHYEGAVALTHRLPALLIAERGVQNRGIVGTGAGKQICFIPQDAQPNFVDSPDFEKSFAAWRREIDSRKDVFLGYCSQNVGTAAMIEMYLRREGATVLNYNMDFRAGVSILEEISEACKTCSGGVFLFGENDPLEGKAGGAAPRDNVVFAAGYFMSSKGPDRCLIVRIGDAKMPADLGGAIYLHLADPNDISPIETRLRRFLSENL